jgi:dTDP-4-amino-4,6-dideoxygalactose transaminase
LADRLRLLRNWGSKRKYHHEEFGLNSRLDTLQAAILNVKLRHLPRWNDLRRQHAATYDRLLYHRPELVRPLDTLGNSSIYHLYVVRCQDRDARLARLAANGVQAGIHYPFPLHRLNVYRHLATTGKSFPQAEAWAAECLSLPMFPELTEEQIAFVVKCLV